MPPVLPFNTDSSAIKAEPDDGTAFSMVIACGPFTQDLSLDFKPWKSFFDRVKQQQPDVLLLV